MVVLKKTELVKIENLEKQLAEMQEQFDKMQKQLDELKEVKVEKSLRKKWKPEINEEYYFIDDWGIVSSSHWSNDKTDNWRYLTSNVFKTEEEAEEHKKKLEIQAQFRNFVEERNEELDWNDCNQSKWYMYYNHYRKKIMFLDETYDKNQGTIYASSEQILKDAIAEIGEDNIKKYILEVEE